MSCIQNQETIANKHLLKNKVAAFTITGGQDNVQAVAGQMLGFFCGSGMPISAVSLHCPLARVERRRHGAE